VKGNANAAQFSPGHAAVPHHACTRDDEIEGVGEIVGIGDGEYRAIHRQFVRFAAYNPRSEHNQSGPRSIQIQKHSFLLTEAEIQVD
jgi:hypothetical protein